MNHESKVLRNGLDRNDASDQPIEVVVLPGDGVGPEVCHEAIRVLKLVVSAAGRPLKLSELLVGGAAIDQGLPPLPEDTRRAVLQADGVLFGAVGLPRLDGLPREQRPEQGLGQLRQVLGVFANLRPVRARMSISGASSLRAEVIRGTDLIVVRELLGDVYYGVPRGISGVPRRAVNTMTYSEEEIRRIAIVAFDLAEQRRQHVTSVDKANVLETSRLWRDVVSEVARDYPAVTLRHLYVDAAALELAMNPRQFDVLLTGNMFGDILSDQAAAIAGSIGLLPSSSLGLRAGLFEPIHGSAPDIAGRGIANPIGAVCSVADMLRWSLAMPELADRIEAAIDDVLDTGYRTRDLGGTAGTTQIGDEICRRLERELQSLPARAPRPANTLAAPAE